MCAGLVIRFARIRKFAKCDRGATIVEFGLVLPALAALLVGGIYSGLAVYSATGLHSAAEQAARCYSVNASVCGTPSATQAYAQTQYYGIKTPTFSASVQPCGHQVAATVTIPIIAVVANFSVPLSATACFP